MIISGAHSLRDAADIGTYAPGRIVATRTIVPKARSSRRHDRPEGTIVPKAGNLADTTDAWQISYRTDDSHDRAELTVTTQAGHAVLDGIRTVKNLGTGGVGPWALNGYSGGAQATG